MTIGPASLATLIVPTILGGIHNALSHRIMGAVTATTLGAQNGMTSEWIKRFAALARRRGGATMLASWVKSTLTGRCDCKAKPPADSEYKFVVM